MKAPTCPQCQSAYTLKSKEFGRGGKQPFLLHCGHTFCETCLQKLPRKEDCINCPTCQVPTKAPSGQPLYKSLSQDIYILGLIWAKRLCLEQQVNRETWEESKQKRRKDVKSVQKTGAICGECKVQPASCECRQCEDTMCKQCFDRVHKLSFSLQRHQALPYFAVSEERSPETRTRSRTCLVHEHCQIEYFCKEDNKAICSRCVIVGDHQGHAVQTMEDKNRDALTYIESAIRVAQETVWRLNKAEKSLTDALPFARRDTKELEEQLRIHFQELHSLIQAREQQLLDEIKTASTSVGDITQEMKAYINEEKCMLEAAIQDGLQTLQGSIHRLVDADLVLERLEHAKDVSCVITQDGEECTNNHIRFLHGEFQPLKESILKYGSISVTSSQMFELRLPGPDDEKPPSEELCLPSVSDIDSLSFTESESLADSASVIVEEEKEEQCGAEEVKPKMAVYPCLKPMIPGHHELVQVTHIRTPGQFFVHQMSKVEELHMLSRQLNSYCRSSASKKDPIGVLVPGDRVLAQFSEDKKWYRAVVNNIVPAEKSNKEEDSFVVFYIDYGNCEVTTLKSLRKAPKNFFKVPSFALECALHDISPSNEQEGWSRESVEMMLQMTVSGPLIMTVLSQPGNVLEVDLSCPEIDKHCSEDRPVSVRDSLVFLEAAIFKSGSSAAANPGRTKRDYLTLPRFLDGKLLDIIVTCANSPHSIYAQCITSTESYLHCLEQRMLDLYSQESKGLYTVFCPRKGMICAAQYGQDKLWYRARILDILGGRKLLVQYVDYGNTEIIHHTQIRKILDDDIKFPAQAIECWLSDVEPADGNNEWSEEAKAWISRQVFQKVCQFRVITDSTKSNSVSGVLYANDVDGGRLVCINSELVKHGFASSTGKWSQPPKLETFEGVTLTAREQRNLIQVPEMDEAVSKTQKSPPVLQPSPGQRLSPSPNVYSAVVSSYSTQANRKASISPNQGASQKVDTYRSNGVLLQQNETSPGQQSLPTAVSDEKPNIHSVAVRIAEYQSPGHFYIQLQDKSRELDSMMTEMSEYNSTDQMDREWKAGDYCAARYSKDQSWYRGRVGRNLEDGSFEVFLVDYGFTDILSRSQLRLLSKKHGKNECFAERCHLAGIRSAGSSDPTKWTSTAREFMMKQISQGKQLFVKLEGEAVPELGLPVDIVIEEIVPETAFDPAFKKYVSLIELLLGQGLALPVKGKKRSSTTDTGSQCFQAKVTVSASRPVMTVHESNSQDSLKPETVVLMQPDFDVAPHPPPSASVMVVVPVYVDYSGVIFAHDVNEEEMLSKLIKNMDLYAQHEAPKGRLEVKPGQICLAHYSADDVWYRARVLEVDVDTVKVKYIDFGNIACVSREKLKLATADICKIPQLAFQLVLHNIRPNTADWSWPTPVLEYMHAEIVNYKCTVEVKSGSSAQRHKGDGDGDETQTEVNLMLSNGRSLIDILLDMGMVVPRTDIEDLYQRTADISHILKHSNPYSFVNLGEVEDTVQVLVTHLELPDLVYLQRFSPELDAPLSKDASNHRNAVQKSLQDFITLMDNLNNLPPQTPAFDELPVPGEMCCAKYSLDGRWYRGLVVKSYPASNTVLVFYVDYGNSEIVSLKGLRVLPQRFQDTEAQAVRVYLNVSLPQGNEHWTLDLYKAMAEAIYIKCHWAKIKNTDPLTVELYTDNPDECTTSLSYESLVNEGLVVASSLYVLEEQDGDTNDDGVII